ncbi:MAG: hypothetical protein E6Q84_00365 [Thiothrix sp.]|nr:MAG: hypothetical protein E6Q84_00365 [Thiothrix sp.]
MPIRTESPRLGFKYQQGTVLLWGLVGLLVLAGLGVAASRISMVDTRIVGNVMFDDFTYQGAESALRRSVNLYNIKQTAEQKVADNTDKTFGPYHDGISAGEQITSSSAISMGAGITCPPILSGVAMSTSMTPKSGNIACRLFTVAADSQVSGTSAQSQHVAGILKYVPAE